jgi:hypothetical protein
MPSAGSAYSLRKDKLNLSGLLNVLDGVVDTPERIVGKFLTKHTYLVSLNLGMFKKTSFFFSNAHTPSLSPLHIQQ